MFIPTALAVAGRWGRPPLPAAVLACSLALAACGDASTAPRPIDPTSTCGPITPALPCPSRAAFDSARVLAHDAATHGAVALQDAATRHLVLDLLGRLTLALERQDGPTAIRLHAELASRMALAEATAAQLRAADWPDVVALRLQIDHLGAALGIGASGREVR